MLIAEVHRKRNRERDDEGLVLETIVNGNNTTCSGGKEKTENTGSRISTGG